MSVNLIQAFYGKIGSLSNKIDETMLTENNDVFCLIFLQLG